MRICIQKKSMKTEEECFEYLAKISTPQLSENDKDICEGKLTLQNIWEALNSMKNVMNVDAKIASKALSFRLKQVLPNLINYEQTAYVKGRFIGESIRLIDDILYHTEQENIDGILFAADIEKAFDSVEHNFIFASLKRFGFGVEFIEWIRTLLFNVSSCITIKT